MDEEYNREITNLLELSEKPAHTEAMQKALLQMAHVRTTVANALKDQAGASPEEAATVLRGLSEEVTVILRAQPWPDHRHACNALTRTLSRLTVAEAALGIPLPQRPSITARQLIIPSDLLYQAHHQLIPAERMLVASGRRSGQTTVLGALFEVTGESGLVHVRADPTRLGRALIAMDLSETYLAAWLHSHPGLGREATHPSVIDLDQHDDWLRNYSPHLVSVIIVADGWIRFWGTALQTGAIDLQITGAGITQEDEDGFVYRLAQ